MSLLKCVHSGYTFIPITIQEDDAENGMLQILEVVRENWSRDKITFRRLNHGITNKIIACQYDDGTDSDNPENMLILRIYGNRTDLLIDRQDEIINMKILSGLKLGPQIYGIFKNGLAYEFFKGEHLDVSTVRDINVWPLIARRLAQMHSVNLKDDVGEPMLWSKLEQFLSLLPEPFSNEEKQRSFVKSFGSVTKLRIEYEQLKSHLSKSQSPIVFAHNDLLLGNVIYNADEATTSFIDFEYTAYNYQAFDIANHFNEFVGLSIDDIDYSRFPDRKFQWDWLKCYLTEYLKRDPTDEEIEQVYKDVQHFVVASHFFWGIWSYVQFEISVIDFDYGRYGEIRLNKYFELKNNVYKEISNYVVVSN